MSITVAAVASVAAVAAAGCASLAPSPPPAPPAPPVPPAASQPAAGSSPGSPIERAQATHEYPAPAPTRQSAPGSSSAAMAVAQFAAAYINWTAKTVAADMAALAERSVGQARSAMELAAAQTGSDYELQRGGIANSGTVEAVAPLSTEPGRYVVVTLERTTATATDAYQGLQPTWHVAVASVVRLGRSQWVVSGWQPES